MPKYIFDFTVNAWIKNYEVEADSLEEAKAKLLSTDLSDIVSEASVREADYSDIECSVEDKDEDYEYDDEEYEIEIDEDDE